MQRLHIAQELRGFGSVLFVRNKLRCLSTQRCAS